MRDCVEQLAPKKGLLKSIVGNFLSGKHEDIIFIPVVIDYEKVMELGAYAAEMLGYKKRKESLKVGADCFQLLMCWQLNAVFFCFCLFVYLCMYAMITNRSLCLETGACERGNKCLAQQLWNGCN